MTHVLVLLQGIEHCRQALDIDPLNVAARYVLAFGLLGFSKECISSGGFVWGASLLEVGLLALCC